jgi:hypothetical protein
LSQLAWGARIEHPQPGMRRQVSARLMGDLRGSIVHDQVQSFCLRIAPGQLTDRPQENARGRWLPDDTPTACHHSRSTRQEMSLSHAAWTRTRGAPFVPAAPVGWAHAAPTAAYGAFRPGTAPLPPVIEPFDTLIAPQNFGRPGREALVDRGSLPIAVPMGQQTGICQDASDGRVVKTRPRLRGPPPPAGDCGSPTGPGADHRSPGQCGRCARCEHAAAGEKTGGQPLRSASKWKVVKSRNGTWFS